MGMSNCRVVKCPIDQLEAELAKVEGHFAPVAWDFFTENDQRMAVCVLARMIPQPMSVDMARMLRRN